MQRMAACPGFTVVIVGGGCSGTLAAIHLLRGHIGGQLSVVIAEPSTLGSGVAYGTKVQSHLLNVPAKSMSAFAEHSAHFLEWAQRRWPCTTGDTFLPRMAYADYLRSVLGDVARAAACTGASLVRLTGEVVSVNVRAGTQRALVRTETSGQVEADHVLLALGNLPPANPQVLNPGFYRSPHYVPDPWAPGALNGLKGPVLLIGSGLTAMDVVLALDDSGHPGPVHAVSRRGLLPQPHNRPGAPAAPGPGAALPAMLSAGKTLRIREILSRLRADADHAADWRLVVDGLRPWLPRIWSGLSEDEKRRFLRHVARYWDVHRHRMPPPVAGRIAGLLADGYLTIHAGTVFSYEEHEGGVQALVRSAGSTEAAPIVPRVNHVVNCTGSNPDVTAAGSRLLDSLLVAGHVRPGPVGLGLDVDQDGAVIDAHGDVHRVLWAIGPLCKGARWETTAVPEIRAQAAVLAGVLTRPRKLPIAQLD